LGSAQADCALRSFFAFQYNAVWASRDVLDVIVVTVRIIGDGAQAVMVWLRRSEQFRSSIMQHHINQLSLRARRGVAAAQLRSASPSLQSNKSIGPARRRTTRRRPTSAKVSKWPRDTTALDEIAVLGQTSEAYWANGSFEEIQDELTGIFIKIGGMRPVQIIE
jgi:hypothetical protein